MPRVKFDYVVSFSSEDPENQAANLLASEVSKKKWLCKKGEPSCSVVLQLPRAVEISAVHIGAYHAALVEVLVGLSERTTDPFQVLVPSCVFVPPAQSRRDEGVARVRSFTGEELTADTRGKRYDRVRVVCSQPYNKHCQYGLSFIHIHEPESRKDPAPPMSIVPSVPSRMFNLDTFSSDEEDFRPGELFAKHIKSPNSSDNPGATNTDAQIRQATSQALKNISDSSTKLLKTPINKAGTSRQKQTEEVPANRQRDSIMYTDDDTRPHDKIDRVVKRHNDEKTKDDDSTKAKNMHMDQDKEKKKIGTRDNSNREQDMENKNNTPSKDDKIINRKQNKQKERPKDTNSNVPEQKRARKRKHDDDLSVSAGEVCDGVSEVLRGVTLALSGYAGARRAALRDKAMALGARYSVDWNPRCTHLICAFPNTPKLRTARAGRTRVPVTTGDWLDECLTHRRRLPWTWYATVPAERTDPYPLPKDNEPEQDRASSDRNTDDEIEEAMKTVPLTSSPTPGNTTMQDSDVYFVKDERFAGQVSLLDSDDDSLTDCQDDVSTEEKIDPKKALPDFFENYTFVITEEALKDSDPVMLNRYVRAFGGLVLQENEIEEYSQVDYVICSEGSTSGGTECKGRRVRPSWVWRCARERRMCPVDDNV